MAKLRWVRAGPFCRKKSPCPCPCQARVRVRVVEFSSNDSATEELSTWDEEWNTIRTLSQCGHLREPVAWSAAAGGGGGGGAGLAAAAAAAAAVDDDVVAR